MLQTSISLQCCIIVMCCVACLLLRRDERVLFCGVERLQCSSAHTHTQFPPAKHVCIKLMGMMPRMQPASRLPMSTPCLFIFRGTVATVANSFFHNSFFQAAAADDEDEDDHHNPKYSRHCPPTIVLQ